MNVMIHFVIVLFDIAAVTGVFVMWDNLEKYLIFYLPAYVIIIFLNVRYWLLVKNKKEK